MCLKLSICIAHRVIIASLFLPETVYLGEGSEASTPTTTQADLPQRETNGASVAARRLLSGTSSPRSPLPKTPAFVRSFSATPTPPVPKSIVDDLTGKVCNFFVIFSSRHLAETYPGSQKDKPLLNPLLPYKKLRTHLEGSVNMRALLQQPFMRWLVIMM